MRVNRKILHCAVRVSYRRLASSPTNLEDVLDMTRTPTTSVTAIAIAARAFAWDIHGGARDAAPKLARICASSFPHLPLLT